MKPFILSDNEYTVFTLTDCIYCDNLKTLLKNKNVDYIVCDEYIGDNKDLFLEHMSRLGSRDHRTFPFVFRDKVFLGGYEETKEILDKELVFHEEDF